MQQPVVLSDWTDVVTFTTFAEGIMQDAIDYIDLHLLPKEVAEALGSTADLTLSSGAQPNSDIIAHLVVVRSMMVALLP